MREGIEAARAVFNEIANDARGRIAQGLAVDEETKVYLFFAQLLDGQDEFGIAFAIMVAHEAYKKRIKGRVA